MAQKNTITLSSLIPNKDNPRFIKDERFAKLVKSLKEFPEMMEKRQIVIDSWESPVILGGNMRHRALTEAGYTVIPKGWIQTCEGWTEKKKAEFVLKDNASFGEWDWEILSKGFTEGELADWGIEKDKKVISFEVSGDFADQGIPAKSQYAVIITCKDEVDQQKVFEKMQSDGYTCKIVVT